jgi:hypothetical protein
MSRFGYIKMMSLKGSKVAALLHVDYRVFRQRRLSKYWPKELQSRPIGAPYSESDVALVMKYFEEHPAQKRPGRPYPNRRAN